MAYPSGAFLFSRELSWITPVAKHNRASLFGLQVPGPPGPEGPPGPPVSVKDSVAFQPLWLDLRYPLPWPSLSSASALGPPQENFSLPQTLLIRLPSRLKHAIPATHAREPWHCLVDWHGCHRPALPTFVSPFSIRYLVLPSPPSREQKDDLLRK